MMPTIRGYAAVFYNPGDDGTEFVFDGTNVIERIHRKAFKRTLAERYDITALWNHEPDLILGRSATGTLALATDSKGLRFTIGLPNTSTGRTVAELVNRGDLDGASFSFLPVDVEWSEEGDEVIRTILDAEVLDVGPVTFPAYSGTSVELGGTVKRHHQRFRPTPWSDGLREACSGNRKLITAAFLDAKILQRKADEIEYLARLAERRNDKDSIERMEKLWRKTKRSMKVLTRLMKSL